ncbi:MAG: hypothetical protein BWK78_02775, partial [Thiotrichaceae bacterium IS1]
LLLFDYMRRIAMSSQNLFLDQRMKGKESFPDTVPWRDSLVRWAKVGVLSACALGGVLPVDKAQAATCSGTQGNLAVSPTSLDFGTVNVGSSNPLTLTVSNTGCASLSVGTLTNNSSVFKLQSTTCSTTIAAGGSCAINFAFIPTVAATVTNSYTLSTNANSVSVSLKGAGKASTLTAPASVSGASLTSSVAQPATNLTATSSSPSAVTTSQNPVTSSGNECVIDLNNNTHTCQNLSAITFVSSPVNHQAVIKVNFDPKTYKHTKAVFEVTYSGQPTGYTVDIGDSKSCNGNGGDAGDTSNAAEVEINGTAFNLYSNTLTGYDTQTINGGLALLNKPNIVTQGSTVSLEVSNERIGWNFATDKSELKSKYLFTLNGQSTLYGPVDYDVYAAFNRVIESTRRTGVGASSVRVKLVQEGIQEQEVTQEPSVPPLVLPTQLPGTGEWKLSLHNRTHKVRFYSPGGEPTQATGQRSTRKVTTTQPGFAIPQPVGLSPSATPEVAARHFLTNSEKATSFGLTPTTELTLMNQSSLPNGRSTVRFQQAHNGVPVLGGEIVVQMDSVRNVMAIAGEIFPISDRNPAPVTTYSITEDIARQIALEKVARQYQADASILVASTPELRIYNPEILGLPGPRFNRLVWRVEVTPISEPLPIKEVLLIDANLGSIAFSYSDIQNALVRQVYDNNNNSSLGLPGNIPVRSEGGNITGVADVNNAYDYAGDVYNFYSTMHERNSIDNNGMTLVSTVRYCDPSLPTEFCPYQQAFWNGVQMVYGQDYASADDVVGHELTHGVTQHTSGLFYFYQSGAINESFSDLWGELIDQNNNRGNDAPQVKWQMGEDLPVGAIRNMGNPPSFSDPDKMTSSFYNCEQTNLGGFGDAGGVHTNSGVNNKAAYLMTDGGNFNDRIVSGLGSSRVANLYYEVQTNLLTSASDYADLYDALWQACVNLQYTTQDCEEVKKALDAVEMNKQPTRCPVVQPSVPVCDNPLHVPVDQFYNGFESGGTNWDINGYIKDQFGNDTTTPSWFVPQNSLDNPYLRSSYATKGTGNAFGFDQGSFPTAGIYHGGISDTRLSMRNAVGIPPSAFMRFDHAYSFESDNSGNYDGGVLEYSADGGIWTDANSLIMDNSYNGSIAANWDNPLARRAAFVADSRGYISTRLNLSSLSGKQVKFRFRMGTDEIGYDYGWFIDEVRIYSCKTPAEAACATAAEWDGTSKPNAAVKVSSGNVLPVAGSSTPIEVGTLCNYGTIQVTNGNLLHIKTTNSTTGFIENRGTITALGTTPSQTPDTGASGSSIKLNAGNLFLNTGTVQAGHGQLGYLQGGNGGSVEITAATIDHGVGTIAAGKGGEGNAPRKPYPGVNVNGGNGGKITLSATTRLTLGDPVVAVVNSGTGGNATVYCPYTKNLTDGDGQCLTHPGRQYTGIIAKGGEGGEFVLVSPNTNLSGLKAESGRGIAVEPNTITAGADTRIEAKEDIIIFGGDDWVLDLRNLSEGAISTPGNITLAVGNGSSVDLRGIKGKAFNAGGQFKVLSDKVVLDAGVTLENIATATGGIVTGPSKILRKVSVNAPTQLLGQPNTTLPIELTITNVGPEGDAYTLTVKDSAGWTLGTLSSPVMITGLGQETLKLDVTLPSTLGATDVVTVTAVSQADSSVVSSAEIQLSVVEEEKVIKEEVKYTASGNVLDGSNPVAGVTVKTGDKTTTTDASGHWEVAGLDDSTYTITATKDGYTITPQDFTVKGENVTVNLAAVKVGPPQVSGTITTKVGTSLSGAKVEVTKMDNSQVTQTTTTDANGHWEVTGLPAGNYTATVSAPGYNSVVQQFEVSDSNSEAKVIISPPRPLLTLNMTSSPSQVRPGEKVTYTLTVTNTGTVTATGVALKLTLPTGITLDQLNGDTCDASQLSCTLPSLTPGAKAKVTLVVIAGSEGGKFDLSATLTSNDYPSDVSTATLELLPYLSVTPSCVPTKDVPMLGDWQCDWTVELSPDAPEAVAKDVQVTLTIPQGVTVSSATADVGTVTPQTAKVLWTLNDLSITSVNRATLTMAMKLTDMFLLALTQEAKVTATNYPSQTARARTAIFIDDSIKVDLALVIDITGSMQGEIDGVKAALKQFIATVDASQSPTVALIVFKDVVTVKAFTKDLNALLKVV